MGQLNLENRLLLCLQPGLGWIAHNFLSVNECKTEVIMFGPSGPGVVPTNLGLFSHMPNPLSPTLAFDNALKLDKPRQTGCCQLLSPEVGTNLTDVTLKKKRVTVRELGGCMGPIWPSYFNDCSCVIFMVDSANTSQVSSSCIQLLSVLAAEPLQTASVLVLFNKRDLPCTMSLVEVKSLFRMDDIVASATQPITTLELSARSGQGLQEVLAWLDAAVTK